MQCFHLFVIRLRLFVMFIPHNEHPSGIKLHILRCLQSERTDRMPLLQEAIWVVSILSAHNVLQDIVIFLLCLEAALNKHTPVLLSPAVCDIGYEMIMSCCTDHQ